MVTEFFERGAYLLVDEWGLCLAVLTTIPGACTRDFRSRVYAALRAGWRAPRERTLPRWP